MFQRMKFAALERRLTRTYKDRLATLGAVPKGVFWRNQSTQTARFDALLSIVRKISPVAHPAVADIGCGYGALYKFIQKTPRYQTMRYSGYDINAAMISACADQFADQKDLFAVGKYPSGAVDFCLFSGTFNLCHTDDYELWEDYILHQLAFSWARVRYGLILNITSLETAKINNHIFYVNPEAFAKKLASRFGAVSASPTQFVPQDTTFIICKEKHERHTTKLRKAQR